MRRATKLVLFPVRFLYTAATERVGTNDAAVDRYLDAPQAPSMDLVAAARAWRTRTPFDDVGAIELLDQQMVRLYLHYVDDHIARLETPRSRRPGFVPKLARAAARLIGA